MKYDYIGLELLKIAAFLYAARYFVAAVFMGPGLNNWDRSLFEASYGYVGNGLTIFACISALVGIISFAISIALHKNPNKA